MLEVGQTFNTVAELLRAMVPGQRVIVHESIGPVPHGATVLTMHGRTLQNAASKANRGQKGLSYYNFFKVVRHKRLARVNHPADMVVKYGPERATATGLVAARRPLVISRVEGWETMECEDFEVKAFVCARKANEDSLDARSVGDRLLPDEFFIRRMHATPGGREFANEVEAKLLRSATETLRAKGVTHLLTTALQRLPTARLGVGVTADEPPFVTLTLPRRWLQATLAVYPQLVGPHGQTDLTAAEEHDVARGLVDEWYAEHVVANGVRWADFGFSVHAESTGRGIAYHLRADYGRLRAAAARIGVETKSADAMARRLSVGTNEVQYPMQPVDPVWLDGCDESLTVPTEERIKQSWDGLGVWCKTTGVLVRRTVFAMPEHEHAVDDATFEYEVRADLERRGIPWPWYSQ